MASPNGRTDHHAVFWAWDLSKRSQEDGFSKVAASLMGARVDLNPHQVDAALFALKSPLSRGVLLADEVGLGKTIEAGIVIAQRWAERKRRILLIVPATLRKQWAAELWEKFSLPSLILERQNHQQLVSEGVIAPFDQDGRVVIVSLQFGARHGEEIARVPWSLVVIDEAHRVRNSWQKSHKTGQALRQATAHTKKILLTATPLQNNAMELFGLLGFIDPHVFGSEESFRFQYLRLATEERFDELRTRIAPFVHRTLRRQVVQYVPYTKRLALTETYTPGNDEQSLYDDFTAWLATPTLNSLPSGQRHLITLVLHKLLASSTFALEAALGTMVARLRDRRELLLLGLTEDLEGMEDQEEEWDEDQDQDEASNLASLGAEIDTLVSFQNRAKAVGQNAKGNKLITALDQGFQKMRELGAADKAIIFTESRRTQQYLVEVLADSSYGDSIVLFNGSNNSPETKAIYRAWLEKHTGSDTITGSASADTRAALVEYFRDHGRIMIATEAAAEGVNLQFCSLVINYDLPWNPQRIEQRIGRCHRYGQKFDVVVVNFLNTRNQADVRVFQLLNDKLRLFEGVFGASDEVLGALGAGVDFERRILGIYQTCRTRDQIDRAFGQLQLEFDGVISREMSKTKRLVLENLDEEVHTRLKLLEDDATVVRTAQERALYALTQHLIGDEGTWDDVHTAFRYQGASYALRPDPQAQLYWVHHPLAEELLDRAKALTPEPAELSFRFDLHRPIGALADWVGRSGWMRAEVLTRESAQETEDLIIVGAITDDGTTLDPEAAQKLFQLPAEARPLALPVPEELQTVVGLQRKRAQDQAQERQQEHFGTEIDKLDLWAEDLKEGLEQRLKELARGIKEARKASSLAVVLEDKLNLQRRVRELEKEQSEARKRLFDAQDEIDQRRDGMIAEIEGQLKVSETVRGLFTLRWRLQ